MKQKLVCKKVWHYPRLDTVIAVEDAIRDHSGVLGRTELWKKLDKKMMYQTFKMIVDYLIKSNKVTMKDGKIVWIFNPELMKKLEGMSKEV